MAADTQRYVRAPASSARISFPILRHRARTNSWYLYYWYKLCMDHCWQMPSLQTIIHNSFCPALPFVTCTRTLARRCTARLDRIRRYGLPPVISASRWATFSAIVFTALAPCSIFCIYQRWTISSVLPLSARSCPTSKHRRPWIQNWVCFIGFSFRTSALCSRIIIEQVSIFLIPVSWICEIIRTHAVGFETATFCRQSTHLFPHSWQNPWFLTHHRNNILCH